MVEFEIMHPGPIFAFASIETLPSKITFSSIKAPFSIETLHLNLTFSISAKETPLLRNFFALERW